MTNVCEELSTNGRVKPLSTAVRVEVDPNNPDFFCHVLVTELVNHCLGNLLDSVPVDILDTIVSKLRHGLLAEMEKCDIPVQGSKCRIPSIMAATYWELYQMVGPKELIVSVLLQQRDKDYKFITETLKKHLLTPEKKSITSVLTSMKSAARTCIFGCIILPDDDDEERLIM